MAAPARPAVVLSSRSVEVTELEEATGQHQATEGRPAGPGLVREAHLGGRPIAGAPRAARPGRRFKASRVREPGRFSRREGGHQDRKPSAGNDSEGIPRYPAPLPGSDHYRVKQVSPSSLAGTLDIGPPEAYYSRGLAHGVPAPEHHVGRITADDQERTAIAASRAVAQQDERPGIDPVPVYMVDLGGGTRPLARAAYARKQVNAPGGDPVMLAGRDPHRTAVLLLNESAADAEATGSLIAEGNTAAGPSPGTNVTSLALPAGEYTVQAYVTLSGTVTFADINNTELVVGSTVIGAVPNQGSAEVVNQSGPYTVVIPTGGQTLFLVIRTAGSGTAAYYGTLVATPQTITANIIRIHAEPGGLPDGPMLNPNATGYLTLPTQDEIWAITDPTGAGQSFVSVISVYDVAGGG